MLDIVRDPWEPFAKDGIHPDDDWSSIIFIRVFPNGLIPEDWRAPKVRPVGYVFVIEPARRDAKLKLPGGHKERGETPLDTGLRETQGETGLTVSRAAFHYAESTWRDRPSPHWSCLCVADIEESDVAWRMHSHDFGNEGEVPRYLTDQEAGAAVRSDKFLRMHYDRLLLARLI